MRRAPIVLTATVLGTAGVLLFKPLPASSLASATSDGSSSSTGSSSSDSSSTGSSSASSSASTGDTATVTPTPSASASKSSSGVTGTFTGTAVETRFGVTQVKVTLKSGTITAVTPVQLNDDDGRSYEISVSAEPTLRQEVLSAQTAAVSTVSGATYTSLSYEASLQAALDKAGFTAADGSKASTAAPTVEGH